MHNGASSQESMSVNNAFHCLNADKEWPTRKARKATCDRFKPYVSMLGGQHR